MIENQASEEQEITETVLPADVNSRLEKPTEAEDALSAWRTGYRARKEHSPWKTWGLRSAKIAGGGVLVLGALALVNEPTEAPVEVQVVETPEVIETAVAPVVEEVVPPPYDIGLLKDSLMIWSNNETEWVQFDYASEEPVFLHWRDSEGRAALNPIQCTNLLRGGLYRCYVGRSHGRIQVALDQGSRTGTWSVSACADESGTSCLSVGTFPVEDWAGASSHTD